MRRLGVVAIVLCLACASSADAWWGHWRNCGYGGWGAGGYGYRGFGLSVGYGGPWYGGYGGGYCLPPYGYGAYGGYGCGGCGYGGFGTPIGFGYYSYQPYGVQYNPAAGYLSYYVPPSSEPAELNFGPQAMKQFLGLPRDFALGGLRNAHALAGAVLAAKAEAKPADRLVRVSSPEARRKAARYLADGDELFREQNFHGALQRYKLAAVAAPDLAEAYWRQGHALIATHNFDLAAGAFKRAIALTEDLSRGGFRLDQLYAGAAMTKARHLESLAAWALDREQSADPYFLLGVFLTYDGQLERAERFFERAAGLAGFAGGHIAVFLTPAQDSPQRVAPGPPAVPPAAIGPRALPVKTGTEI